MMELKDMVDAEVIYESKQRIKMFKSMVGG
jgi:hypothetical protein